MNLLNLGSCGLCHRFAIPLETLTKRTSSQRGSGISLTALMIGTAVIEFDDDVKAGSASDGGNSSSDVSNPLNLAKVFYSGFDASIMLNLVRLNSTLCIATNFLLRLS